MQTISKVAVYIVLACLLLSWVGGAQRPLHRPHAHNRRGRECHRVLAHLRRCRGGNPNHHPVRPCKNAVLPPDDDDDDIDIARLLSKGIQQRLLASGQDSNHRSRSTAFGSRPLPTEVPRHQTLCILLI